MKKIFSPLLVFCGMNCLVFFLSANTFLSAQNVEIETRQGTHVLTPPEKCINSTCLNGIIRIAELAGAALENDVRTASNEAEKLNNELKTLSAEYDSTSSEYITAKTPYDAKLEDYTNDLKIHNDAVEINNAQKPEDRSTAEVNRLKLSKSNLDSRKEVLDSEVVVLIKKWDDLQKKKNNLNSKTLEVQRVIEKLNKALEQLKLCQSYGIKALKISKEKNWGNYKTINDIFGTLKIVPDINLLNDNLEQLKSWSNKEWD